MTIYDYLIQFYYGLFDNTFGNNFLSSFNTEILGVNIDLQEWLAHTFSIITIILFIIVFIKIAIWLFKMGANLFKW